MRETGDAPLKTLLTTLMLTCLSSGSALSAKPPTTGLRLEATASSKVVMRSEPVWIDVVLHNAGSAPISFTDGRMSRNRHGRVENYPVTVARADGTAVLKRDAGPQMGGRSMHVTLRPGERHQGPALLLAHWVEPLTPGRYTLTISSRLPLGDGLKAGEHVEVTATVPLTVVADDPAKLGAVIGALGREMLAGEDKSRGFRALFEMHDERTIPLYEQLFNRVEATSKMRAMRGLANYADDRALAVLRAGAVTQASDLNPARFGTEALRQSSADSLRQMAASALSTSPHPDALAELLKLADDEYSAIRLTVLHRVATLPAAERTPWLAHFRADVSAIVRGEAERYTRELATRK